MVPQETLQPLPYHQQINRITFYYLYLSNKPIILHYHPDLWPSYAYAINTKNGGGLLYRKVNLFLSLIGNDMI